MPGAKSEFRIFQPTFRARDGSTRTSDTYHVEFKDHTGRRQRITGFTHLRDTNRLAERLMELVRVRRHSEIASEELRKYLDSLPERTLERLTSMDLIASPTALTDKSLRAFLMGEVDGTGKVIAPGWKQTKLATGATWGHVQTVTNRVAALLDACKLFVWRDLLQPDVRTRIVVWLGEQRSQGIINGTTLNYAVRDVKSFVEWLADLLGRDSPLRKLEGVNNADTDKAVRRELATEEMRWLMQATARATALRGLTGAERAFLYRFCFETGLRPNQVRNLTVADFDLDNDPPTVSTHARYVKRRRPHTQVLTAAMADELRVMFKNKLPAATAIRMPSAGHLAEMMREDLRAARAAWLGEPRLSKAQTAERERSDFLKDVNHRKERAVFYSLRHGHGTALAEAGVSEIHIAESMHHASRSTTKRYLHSRRPELAKAIAALPNVAYPSGANTEPRKHRRKRASGS